jgi:predicted transcriptional regulator
MTPEKQIVFLQNIHSLIDEHRDVAKRLIEDQIMILEDEAIDHLCYQCSTVISFEENEKNDGRCDMCHVQKEVNW